MLDAFKKKKNKEQTRKYKYGVVLSGGGTRGFAHLGVLKALEEAGIRPDIISGVSAGSIVGAMYADGKEPEEVLEAITSQKIFQYLDFTIPKTGLVKMTGFERLLRKHLNAENFEDLKIPLKVYAVNINTAEYKCFDSGPLAIAIKASSSIPIIFPPIEVNNEFYCDGGVINNFPVEPLIDTCERVIGVNVNPLAKKKGIDNLKKIAERTFQLTIRSHTIERKKYCHLYIEPEGIGDYGLLELGSGKEIYALGYNATKKALEETNWETQEENSKTLFPGPAD